MSDEQHDGEDDAEPPAGPDEPVEAAQGTIAVAARPSCCPTQDFPDEPTTEENVPEGSRRPSRGSARPRRVPPRTRPPKTRSPPGRRPRAPR